MHVIGILFVFIRKFYKKAPINMITLVPINMVPASKYTS
jgi:hypothetical protein